MTHLFLTGVMGTGKSTVGRLLASRLYCRFVDCNTEIEAVAFKSIRRFFAEEGERAFRELETRVLSSLVRQEEFTVLALGDGTLSEPDNLAMVKQAGPVVSLVADAEIIYQRVQVQADQRSLLKVAEPVTKIPDLLENQTATYPKADVQIDTTKLEPVEVVDEVLDWLECVRVNLGERSYDLHIAEGCHNRLSLFLAELPDAVSSVVIITNREVDRHYGDPLRASLIQQGFSYHTLVVPVGERYKSLQTASRLYGDLIQHKIDRKAVIVALGGGVIGDLAGFVAATYERGVRFIQIPTSLLAHVDSSVGGKVGVNHPLGKNMIGAFKQPLVVFIDPTTIKTLPKRELRSGLAEVIKYGVIWDEEFFAFLENNVENILRLDLPTIKHIIRRSCQIKAHLVEEDELEAGLRIILNFGHTMAHAVETHTSYKRYTHGEAVAIGMVVAIRIAHAMGLLRAEAVHRLTRLLERFNLPTHLPKADPGVLMSLMDTDKKAIAGKVRFVLPTAIGRVETVDEVPQEVIRRAIKESLEM